MLTRQTAASATPSAPATNPLAFTPPELVALTHFANSLAIGELSDWGQGAFRGPFGAMIRKAFDRSGPRPDFFLLLIQAVESFRSKAKDLLGPKGYEGGKGYYTLTADTGKSPNPNYWTGKLKPVTGGKILSLTIYSDSGLYLSNKA